MGLTKQQWMDIAEAQAAADFGHRHRRWFTFRRFLAAPVGLLTLGTLAGLGAYLLWTHVHLPSAGEGPANLPAAFWVFVVALALATGWFFRPGRFIPAAALVIRAVVFALLWLGVATYGFFVLI